MPTPLLSRFGMKTKTGRKQKHHTDSVTGLPVVGLSRMTDGRWRIIGTQTRFSEPDEQKAIAKFYALTGVEDEDKQAAQRAEKHTYPYESKTHPIWKWFADQVRQRPLWVADATGIEQLGYLIGLKPPEAIPTLMELRKLWEKHATGTQGNMSKVRRGFDHFIEATDANSLREITPQLAIDYRDVLHNSGYSGKTQAHIIAGIRRVLTNAKERAVAMVAINTALTYLELLKPSESASSMDPKPIEVADWKKILATAEGDLRAMALLMLNGSYYLGEVIELEWDDITNGCIVTNREKTGKCIRVCSLWEETKEALASVKRRGAKIFYNAIGLPCKRCATFRNFRDMTIQARTSITASQLRDGAYTAAVESGVTFQFCQLLNGHRTGMADKYVKRNPKMVKPACDAIYAKYFS